MGLKDKFPSTSMEIHAAEKSPSLFGKTRSIVDEVPKSSNWKKVV
jgi:hypothetical protein